MRLTTPQIISMFGLCMDFTRDAKFDILNVSDRGTMTVRVSNGLGERGFTIPADGGKAQPVKAMSRPSERLKALAESAKALEEDRTIAVVDPDDLFHPSL